MGLVASYKYGFHFTYRGYNLRYPFIFPIYRTYNSIYN